MPHRSRARHGPRAASPRSARRRSPLSPHATEQFETSALSRAPGARGRGARDALVGARPRRPPTTRARAIRSPRSGGALSGAPLADEEVTRYATIATPRGEARATSCGPRVRARGHSAVAALPVPRGARAPRSGRRIAARLRRYELATRLSFFLWNTTPDDELLDAAAAGALERRTAAARRQRFSTRRARARRWRPSSASCYISASSTTCPSCPRSFRSDADARRRRCATETLRFLERHRVRARRRLPRALRHARPRS